MSGHERRIKLTLKNPSSADILIEPKSAVAELVVPHEISPMDSLDDKCSTEPVQCHVTSVQHVEGESALDSCHSFNFDDSLLPESDKLRIIKRLNKMKAVFAQHEYDIGKTEHAMHDIKLTDNTPFRERARPIRSQDFEDARRHIQQSIDAGIIRPSNSPAKFDYAWIM